jgi:hypothetical protein
MMSHRLTAHRPSAINAARTHTRRWVIGVAAVPILAGVLGGAHPAASTDSGMAGCTGLSGVHPVAAADWPTIGAQFARSRWPNLRISGVAYVEIATRLLTEHAYGGETTWFYERLSSACAKHGRPLSF